MTKGKRTTPCASTIIQAHCSACGERRWISRTHTATAMAAIARPPEARNSPPTIHSESGIMASSFDLLWPSISLRPCSEAP